MRSQFVHFFIIAGAFLLGAAEARCEAGEKSSGPVFHRKGQYLGVATCGSSECHASTQPWRNATVLMKERLIWEQHDSHSKAFKSLSSERGKKIAAKLRIGDAGSAPQCLTCHSTFVPADKRGPHFSLASGVTCESCHGAGGDFLSTHVQTTSTHAGNVAAGMFDTTDPEKRAGLCLSCHQGDSERQITHKLYAAGHPRLRFELDTFSVNQPYHFIADSDYRRRKGVAGHLALWQQGQFKSAELLLNTVDKLSEARLPEFASFDCFLCHQKMVKRDEPAETRPGLPEGQPYLLDSPLVMLRGAAGLVDTSLPATLREETRALQIALGNADERGPALAKLRSSIKRLKSDLADRGSSANDIPKIMRTLVIEAGEENPMTFALAESFAMSLSALAAAEHEAMQINDAKYAKIKKSLDLVYASLKSETEYQPARADAAFKALGREISR